MKQSKAAGIVLTGINVILIVIFAVLYFRLDKTAPKIEFTAADIVYRENMDNDKLFEGITAYDSEDGDVTDRIVIEKTIEDWEENRIVIFYAVSDRAGNVAKASRIFSAVYTEENSREKEEEADSLLQAGINAELNRDDASISSENNTDTGNMPVKDGPETSVPADEAAREASEESVPESEATPVKTPVPAAEDAKESTPEPTPKPTANPAVPVLTLKVSEVTVNTGQGPAWVDVIGTLSDDKDSYETLFKNLNVSKYDKNKAGSYQVTVSTEDSDGNKSQPVPLTIIVK